MTILRATIALATIPGLLLCVLLYRAGHGPSTQSAEPFYGAVVLETPKRQSALFVGDDFPAGYGGVGRNAYPQITCYSIGLDCGVDAQPGTGFVNDGRDYSPTTFPLIDRLPTDQKLFDPDFVIVDAGRNDNQAPVPVQATATSRYFRQVSRIWPAAQLIAIAPYYLSPGPDPDYEARIELLRPIVAEHGGLLIDPAAEGWYDGVDEATMLQIDGLHPNQTGQEFIARKLAKSLQDRRIGQSGAPSS